MSATVRILLVASVLAILGGILLLFLAAFSPDALLTGGTLSLLGAIGLYAGMSRLEPPQGNG